MNEPEAVKNALGDWPASMSPLAGGCVGDVQLIEAADGRRLVGKFDARASGHLAVEAAMLRYLQEQVENVPTPRLVFGSDELLIMEWMPGSTGVGKTAERDLARVLVRLHEHTSKRCGFERDTVIGPIPQPNKWTTSWTSFFGEHRLAHVARLCRESGRLDQRSVRRVEALAGRLDDFLVPPDEPRLLHGDLWSGNILTVGSKVSALIDPALYFGHPEVELAFLSLFRTAGDGFFQLYRSMRSVPRGEFEEFIDVRRHVYNLYPLLVHLHLFGNQYLSDVQSVLGRFAP